MHIETKQVGIWSTQVARDTLFLETREMRLLQKSIMEWGKHFPHEENGLMGRVNVPSTLIRIDYFYKEGTVQVCEIEDRPAGIGVSSALSTSLCDGFISWRDEIENHFASPLSFYVFMGRREEVRRGKSDTHGQCDDFLAAEMLMRKYAVCFSELPRESMLHVRSLRNETISKEITSRSICSMREEGNKHYGLAMGLWTRVSDSETLSFEDSFVFKSMYGSRSDGVWIWHKGGNGTVTKSKITAALKEHGTLFKQTFYTPEQYGKYNMLRRVYAYRDILASSWVIIGGIALLGEGLRLHGTPETISMPLLV